MEYRNVWDSDNLVKGYSSFQDFDSFKEYVTNHLEVFHDPDLLICNAKNEDALNNYDYIYYNQGFLFNYTSKEHPIFVFNTRFGKNEIIIDPSYYEDNKKLIDKLIKECFIEYNINQKPKKPFDNIYIPDYMFSKEELMELMSTYPNLTYKITKTVKGNDNLFDEEFLKFLEDNKISTYYDNKLIYEEIIIGSNKKDIINSITRGTLPARIDQTFEPEQLKRVFEIAPDNVNIMFRQNDNLISVEDYYKNIKDALDMLELDYIPKVSIDVDNLSKFVESGILDLRDKFNFSVSLSNGSSVNDMDRLLYVNNKLEELVAPYKEQNLSPYERYLAAYNKAKLYKPYKQCPTSFVESRDLDKIVDNEYLVCTGFSRLLKDFSQRLDVPIATYGTKVEAPKGFNEELGDYEVIHDGHARNVVYLNDPKYNINGIYLADSTWDNKYENDSYLYPNMTIDESTSHKVLTLLTPTDVLIDFKNDEDFKEKASYFLSRLSKNMLDISEGMNIPVTTSNNKAYTLICNIANMIDKEGYKSFREENDQYANEDMSKVLVNYYDRYKDVFNKPISFDTTLKAAEVVKRVDGLNDEQIEEWKVNTTNYREALKENQFPAEMWEITTQTLDNSKEGHTK